MQQSVTQLWEDLDILHVFGFAVGFLVVWVCLCMRKVGSCFSVWFEWFFLLEWGMVWLFVGEELIWGNTSNRKQGSFQKQCLSGFCLLIWASRLHTLNFDGCCGTQSFQIVFLLNRTHNHWDPKPHAHITNMELENVWLSDSSWFLMAWKQFFPCCDHPSMLAFKIAFHSEMSCFLQIYWGRERKCLLIALLRCSNFN